MAEPREGTGQGAAPRRQRKVGIVVSDKMEKTVVVAVERLVAHPRYGKRIRRTSTFLAHDEQNRCKAGDLVAIEETRPLSRRKRWRVTAVLKERAREVAAPAESEILP